MGSVVNEPATLAEDLSLFPSIPMEARPYL